MTEAEGATRHRAAASCALVSLLAALLLIGTAPARGQGQGAQGAGGNAAKTPDPPQISATAWLLVDARDGSVLAGSKQTRTLPIASTTKLMTAYVVLEELDLDEKISAPGYDALPVESVLGLRAGEKMSVRDLLTAMMLPSANDAAYALAEGAAGSVSAFVDRMNEEATRLGLDDTSYTTPIGLDDPGNGSSARDLAALAAGLMEDKRFREIVSQTQATLETGATPRTVTTRNTLMFSDPTVNGIKTGHTLGAGYVLVASAERGGIPLISVVLGAAGEAERDAASEQLLDYGYSLYQPRVAVERGEELGSVPVTEGDPESLALSAGRSYRVTARADQQLEIELDAPPAVEGPIARGERLGSAEVLLDGERIGSVPVVAGAGIAAPSWIDQVGGPLAVLLIAGGSILLIIASVIAVRRSGRLRPEPEGRERARDERPPRGRRRGRPGQENDTA